jgi:hypothetical protein
VAAALDELLVIADRTLTAAGAAHALIGGCARNLYAPPRSTRDVDLAVSASPEQYERVALELRRQGFVRVTETRTQPASAVPDVALFSDASGGRIDLLLAHTAFEERAIARAVLVHFEQAGFSVRVVRVEDLIVYKTLAGRPRDLTDIEEVVRAQVGAGVTIDWKYIEDECAQWDALEVLQQARDRAAL